MLCAQLLDLDLDSNNEESRVKASGVLAMAISSNSQLRMKDLVQPITNKPQSRSRAMSSEVKTCPYCNTPLPDHLSGHGGPIICSRCGEAIPTRGGRHCSNAQGYSASVPRRETDQPELRLSNRWLAAGILAVMLAMAALALSIGLKTVPFRRANDPKELLGYLPADTNVVAVIHADRALQELAGRALLTRLRIGSSEAGLQKLTEWTGLQVHDLGKVVLGLRLDDHLIPRLTVIVQTKKPLDGAALAELVKESSKVSRSGKNLYQSNTQHWTIWPAAESILIVGLSLEDLDAVPEYPYQGITHLPRDLQEYIKNQIDESAQAWVVAESENWQKSVAWPLTAALGSSWQAILGQPRLGGMWLHFDEDVAVHGLLRFAEKSAADQAKSMLSEGQLVRKDRLWVESETVRFETRTKPEELLDRLAKLRLLTAQGWQR
jgi:hypothetical protein